MNEHVRQARRWVRVSAITGGIALIAASGLPAQAESNNNTSRKLRAAVTPAGIAEHLEALDRIGKNNDGTRASGLPGYKQSRNYVVKKLKAAGYSPTVQAFDFPFFRELSPATLAQVSPDAQAYGNPGDFASMTYSFSGDVTADVVPVDTGTMTPTGTSTSGCETADFTGFPAGSIALMQRGTCPFGAKAANAEAAGAEAAIIFNRGLAGDTATVAGTLGSPETTIPVLGASFALGQDLATAGTVVRLTSDTESEIRETYNIFAETKRGDPKNVVMAGAHLDSVVAGPGLNDNGSGSASILEVAEQMAKLSPKNQVRFAWWGAEELGLLGSHHYVDDLSANNPSKLQRIALYLNFDMVGSPNYVRFVYDGDNSAFPVGPATAAGPPGSGAIETMFHDYFGGQTLPSEETPFSGRSDYGPFIAEGIPAGGLFTGAEGVKTEAQAATYGGEAGVAYDKCYHQACDTIANVNMFAVDEMSDAVAHAILSYAMDTRAVNGAGKGHSVPAAGLKRSGTPTGTGTTGGGGLHDDQDHGDPM